MTEKLSLVGERPWVVLRGYDLHKQLPVDSKVVRTEEYVRGHYRSAGVLPMTEGGQEILLGGHSVGGTILWGPFVGRREAGDGSVEDTALREGTEESGGVMFEDLLPPAVVIKATSDHDLGIGVIFPVVVGKNIRTMPNSEIQEFKWFSWGGVAELMDWELDVGPDYQLWGSVYTWGLLRLWDMCRANDSLVYDPVGKVCDMMHRIVSIEAGLGLGGSIYTNARKLGKA